MIVSLSFVVEKVEALLDPGFHSLSDCGTTVFALGSRLPGDSERP